MTETNFIEAQIPELEYLTEKIEKYKENVREIFPDAHIQYFNDGSPRVISNNKDISAYTEFGVQMMGTPDNEEIAWKQSSGYSDFIRALASSRSLANSDFIGDYNKVIDGDNRLIEEFIRK